MKEDDKMTKLMKDGKEIVALAAGGVEFYPMNENADGTISFNGEAYGLGNKVSNIFACTWGGGTTPYNLGINPSQNLVSGSALTLKDLINKGKKIRLIVSFIGTSSASLDSGIIDLSKPDSNGHFNFQWLNGATSTNTYCYSDSSVDMFKIYSDAFKAYTSDSYDDGHMTIIYSDAS